MGPPSAIAGALWGLASVVVPPPPLNDHLGPKRGVRHLHIQRPMRTQNPLTRSQTDAPRTDLDEEVSEYPHVPERA